MNGLRGTGEGHRAVSPGDPAYERAKARLAMRLLDDLARFPVSAGRIHTR